jgi:antitoxin (DNA-binding transcriptional repressor) of toxin-antitoxin stability system
MAEPAAPRDLRHHYGELLRRVAAGEQVPIVKDGVQVAALVPPPSGVTVPLSRLRDVFAGTAVIDPGQFFEDLDAAVDAGIHDPWEEA